MRIDVTQEDIEKGSPDNCRLCPLARAINRATGRDDARVGTCKFWFMSWLAYKQPNSILLPPEAYQFRLDFDTGEPVAAFSFDLDI